MYCPACDKSFSPVHSRCPECKGWLKVSAPGATPASAPAAVGGRTLAEMETSRIKAVNLNADRKPPAGEQIEWSEPTGMGRAAGAGPQPKPPGGGLDPEWWGGGSAPGPGGGNGHGNGPGPGAGTLGSGWDTLKANGPGWGQAQGQQAPAPSGGQAQGWGSGWAGPGGGASGGLGGGPPAVGAGWGTPAGTAGLGGAGLESAGGGHGGPGLGGSGGFNGPGGGHGGPGLGGSGGFGGPGGGHGGPGLGGSGGFGGPGGGHGGPALGGSGGFGGPGGHGAPGLGGPGALGGASSGGLGGAPAGGWLGGGSAPGGAPAGGWLGESGSAPPSATSWGGDTTPVSIPVSISEEPPVGTGDFPEHTLAVDLGTPWKDPSASNNNTKVAMVLVGTVLFGAAALFYVYGKSQQEVKDLKAKTASVVNEKVATPPGEQFLKDAQRYMKDKDYKRAAQYSKDAYTYFKARPETTPQKLQEVSKLRKQANVAYGQQLLGEALGEMRARNWNTALSVSKEAQEQLKEFGAPAGLQAQAWAVRARAFKKVRDFAQAEDCFRRAIALDSGRGYQSELSQVRDEMVPDPPEPAPSEQQAAPPVEQPKLDEAAPGYVRSNYRASGGGHRPQQQAQQPQEPAPQQPRRPVNTYVPPPKRESSLKRPADTFRGYYDTNRYR